MSVERRYQPISAPGFIPNPPTAFGLGQLLTWRAKYDFALDGGAQGLITPKINVTIPDNALIMGGVINPTTALAGATATISIGTSAGSSASSIIAATAVASWTTDSISLVVVPKFTAATFVKLTAAGLITFTVATADLTAGVCEVTLVGFVAAA